jgi:ribonuclease T2
MRHIVGFLWTLVFLGTVPGHAAEQCVLPAELPVVYDVKPDDEANVCLRQTVTTPTEYFMLVFSWSPGFCESQKNKTDGSYPAHLQLQCVDNQFGWVVHGLWAEVRQPQTCGGGAGTMPTE